MEHPIVSFLPIENHPSKSTARNKLQLLGKGLDISPIKQSDDSRLENNFTQAWDEMDEELNNLSTQEKKDSERIKLKQNQTYNKYMEKHKDDIEFKNKSNKSKREEYHKSKNKHKLGNETM